jgi:hypothetical protein
MDEVLRYEESAAIPEHQKTALRYADAFLSYPDRLPPEVGEQMLEHFSPAQIVEISFKLFFNSSNKPVVALGIDEPIDESRLTEFHYEEDGEFVVHLEP